MFLRPRDEEEDGKAYSARQDQALHHVQSPEALQEVVSAVALGRKTRHSVARPGDSAPRKTQRCRELTAEEERKRGGGGRGKTEEKQRAQNNQK